MNLMFDAEVEAWASDLELFSHTVRSSLQIHPHFAYQAQIKLYGIVIGIVLSR